MWLPYRAQATFSLSGQVSSSLLRWDFSLAMQDGAVSLNAISSSSHAFNLGKGFTSLAFLEGESPMVIEAIMDLPDDCPFGSFGHTESNSSGSPSGFSKTNKLGKKDLRSPSRMLGELSGVVRNSKNLGVEDFCCVKARVG
ncbi:hypothetical protein Pfo_027239 [Paulownia fortunei]|nr:hypothetical protein Pfo_027239 [Paulownia fortunei]